MKKAFIAIILLTGMSAFAGAKVKNETLNRPSDFVNITNVGDSEISIFLMYPGKASGRCGVAVRTSTLMGNAVILNSLLKISDRNDSSGKEFNEVIDDQLVATFADENDSRYGIFVRIETRSGEPLDVALSKINPTHAVDVIVESTPCP